jgi:hypothetical protein
METVLKQIKQIIITGTLMLCVTPAISQVARPQAAEAKLHPVSNQLKEFYHLAADAGVSFTYPKGFREIKAPDDEYFSFDYAMELPGKDFEIWFQVKSQKENWDSYEHTQNSQSARQANPDSLYTGIGAAQAIAFTGDKQYFVRNMPPDILAKYKADAGKSYLLTLLDLPETKHYKYALLITLQKNHTGTILAVCFTNVKGPEFFKNMDRACQSVKFKP